MITIKKAKQIRENLGFSHLVIFGITPDGEQHIATHGDSKSNAKEAATAGNNLKKSLGWPPHLCNSTPLSRICEHCSFWQAHFHRPGDRIPNNAIGDCMFNPNRNERCSQDIACIHFDPIC